MSGVVELPLLVLSTIVKLHFSPSSEPMEQKDQAKKERGRRYHAQQKQCGQRFLKAEAADAAAQCGCFPGMPRILQVRAASTDHTVGEDVIDGWRVIMCVDQLRCQLPTA